MAQMSPLKWLLLMFFSVTYLIFASTMYFNMSPIRLDTNQTKINTPYLTWKW